MSSKVYKKIARLICFHRINSRPATQTAIETLAFALADAFEADDPDFKREKFYKGCGF